MSISELSDAFGLDASTLTGRPPPRCAPGSSSTSPTPRAAMARKFRITEEGERLLDEEREGKVRSLDRIMERLVRARTSPASPPT